MALARLAFSHFAQFAMAQIILTVRHNWVASQDPATSSLTCNTPPVSYLDLIGSLKVILPARHKGMCDTINTMKDTISIYFSTKCTNRSKWTNMKTVEEIAHNQVACPLTLAVAVASAAKPKT